MGSFSARVTNPLNDGRGFNTLDDDTLELVAGFLRARDVVALQQCNRWLRVTCRSREVWALLLAEDFDVSRDRRPRSLRDFVDSSARRLRVLSALTEHPYELYRRRYLSHKAVKTQAVRRQKEQETELRVQDRRTCLRYVLDAIEYPLGVGAHCSAIAIFFLLLLLKLNGSFECSYWVVFSPLAFHPAMLVLSLLLGCCVKQCDQSSSGLWNGQDDASESTIFYFSRKIWNDVANRNKLKFCIRRTWFTCMALLVIVAVPLMICLKLQNILPESTTWAVTFVPLWLALGCWCCVPYMAKRLFGGSLGDGGMVLLMSMWLYLPLLIIAAIVAARLDGSYTQAALMFIPLWIVDAVILLVAGVLYVMSCCDSDRDDRPKELAGACVLTAILAIALPAEIIASVVDSRTGQFPVDGFLGPVVALVTILAVLNCVCACILCCKARSNSDFDDAYSPRIIDRVCCCGCFSRGPCCRSRRDEGAPIVVMHAPGLPAMNV